VDLPCIKKQAGFLCGCHIKPGDLWIKREVLPYRRSTQRNSLFTHRVNRLLRIFFFIIFEEIGLRDGNALILLPARSTEALCRIQRPPTTPSLLKAMHLLSACRNAHGAGKII